MSFMCKYTQVFLQVLIRVRSVGNIQLSLLQSSRDIIAMLKNVRGWCAWLGVLETCNILSSRASDLPIYSVIVSKCAGSGPDD